MSAIQYSSEEEEEDLETTLANSIKNKKKELFVVDHDKVYYRPYKKAFYVEVPQIKNMTAEGCTINYTSCYYYCLLATTTTTYCLLLLAATTTACYYYYYCYQFTTTSYYYYQLSTTIY